MASEKGGNYLAFAGKPAAATESFGQHIIREDDYRALFSDYAGQAMVGESSPHYLVSEQACERIQQLRPDARLIVVLRNPVDTIYARYLMRRRNGSMEEAFSTVLDQEEKVLADGQGRSRLQLDTAFYAHHLGKYFQGFPADQISVQLYEDYLEDRDNQLRGLFTFLGVDPQFIPANLRHYNRSGIATEPWLKFIMHRRRALQPALKRMLPAPVRGRIMERLSNRLEKPGLDARDRQRLVAIYRDDILALQSLLQRDLGGWLSEN